MRKLPLVMLAMSLVIVAAAAGLYLAKPPGTIESNVVNMHDEPRHPVSDEQHEDAAHRRGNQAPGFELADSAGRKWSLHSILKQTPAVVVMTKDGCPCSIESQPHFNAISKALDGKVQFVGILDSDQPTATLYKSSLSVPYPILSETTGQTFADYKAKQSVYVYLVRKDGSIAKVWPGYNAAMLAELYQLAATEAQASGPELAFKDAPTEMTSGCYFESPSKNLREGEKASQ